MSVPQDLYFIAIVPPEPVFSELQELRHHFSEKYNSSHALKSPPHVTLISPFSLNDGKEEELKSILKEFSEGYTDIEIELENFSTFGTKVIFVDVSKTEGLINIQQDLEKVTRSKGDIFNYNYDERSYHPHMTLAFKDLSKKNFHKAWKKFKDRTYHASFVAGAITLLKHNGKRWKVRDQFNLVE
ncbi:MAG: 2'-5' RNA ligase family protein [Balneolaceae bacterium]|nr:2'-5' RNA ligase family protein [Balneolaceae bacterium]